MNGFFDDTLLEETEEFMLGQFDESEMKHCAYHDRLEPRHRFTIDLSQDDGLSAYCIEAEEEM